MHNNPSLLPALAPANGGALTTTTGPQRIATRMAENLLGVARSQGRALAAQQRYRIGDYEFREADHAQIQRWARMLGMEPEKVVERLAQCWKKNRFDDVYFRVQDGAIVSLVWDFSLLPLTNWAWDKGLQIARLGILNAPPGPLPSLPDCLHELICHDNPITNFTLVQLPQLKTLDCSGNQLTVLDLTPMPGLQKLYCSFNQLTELDLAPLPLLQVLRCSLNELTELDLTATPRLQNLDCSGNALADFNLTRTPSLQVLNCGSNQLTNLDLTPARELQELRCYKNRLTSLELEATPKLQLLACYSNQLNVLDLTAVPDLQELVCDYNQLTQLDLTPTPRLKSILCDRHLEVTGALPNLEVLRS